MNRGLGHFCANTGSIGSAEPPEDGEMSALQIQGSKFKPWKTEADHATSRSRRLFTIILSFTTG